MAFGFFGHTLLCIPADELVLPRVSKILYKEQQYNPDKQFQIKFNIKLLKEGRL